MNDKSVILKAIRDANSCMNSKSKCATFIVTKTGQKLHILTTHQLKLLGVNLYV